MQRFIQVLLLAACTLLLLPSSLATEAEVLHPLIASVESSPLLQEDTVIRGLMKRQSCASNYYLCDGQGCCPLGWACCQSSFQLFFSSESPS